MATFYSIVYANIRPALEERISIGLVLRDEQKLFFRYSAEKPDVLRLLLPSEAFSLLRTLVKNLDEYIDNPGPAHRFHHFLPDLATFEQKFLDKGYLTYLSTYSNNLLTFSAPKTIDLPAGEESFMRLFQKYVHQDWEATRKTDARISVETRVRRELIRK